MTGPSGSSPTAPLAHLAAGDDFYDGRFVLRRRFWGGGFGGGGIVRWCREIRPGWGENFHHGSTAERKLAMAGPPIAEVDGVEREGSLVGSGGLPMDRDFASLNSHRVVVRILARRFTGWKWNGVSYARELHAPNARLQKSSAWPAADLGV